MKFMDVLNQLQESKLLNNMTEKKVKLKQSIITLKNEINKISADEFIKLSLVDKKALIDLANMIHSLEK